MGSEARARLGFAALLFVVLLSLEQIFATGEYAGPALLAATVATLLMMALRRFGVPAIVTLASSGLMLVGYVVIVFRADRTFYLLPTPDALAGVGRMLERAYAHSQIDYAPVPTRAGYVAMIVVAFWVMASLGELATFRWRRPLIAVIGPLALFALVLVVGTNAMGNLIVPFFLVALMTFMGLESSHRLRTWGQWVATFRGRRAEEPSTITAALARRMGTACVLVALAAPVFLPSIGNGLLSWRNSVGNGVFGGSGSGGGLSGGGSIDPLVSLKSEFLERTDDELFKVTSERPLYWRLITLTEFDGLNWTPAETTKVPSLSGAISAPELEAPPAPAAETVQQRYEITGLSGLALPSAYMPAALEIDGEARELLEFDAATADLQLSSPIPQGLTYRVQSLVPEASYEVLNAAEPGDLPGEYTDTGQVSPAVDDLLARWIRDADTPFEQLLAIQTQLRGFNYSTEVDADADSDYLARFLLETRTGYCQQFATAFTILARRLGMETRVSVGFLPGETSPATPNQYVVRGTDAHAWPEVYFEGLGWIAFEPTPRAEAAPPGYTNPDVATPSSIASLRGPENLVPNPEGGPGGANNTLQDVRDPAGAARGGVGTGAGDRGPSRWEIAFRRLLTVIVIVAIAFLFAIPLLKELRVRTRYSRAANARSRATAAFLDFEDAAGELASPRGAAESAFSYVGRIARARRLPRAEALRLGRIVEAAQYAPKDVSDGEVSEARRLARELKRTLWSGATWWERAARLFGPGRLVSRSS